MAIIRNLGWDVLLLIIGLLDSRIRILLFEDILAAPAPLISPASVYKYTADLGEDPSQMEEKTFLIINIFNAKE